MNRTCVFDGCDQPVYTSVRVGDVCRQHFIQILKKQLGQHAPLSETYRRAIAGLERLPLFPEKENNHDT